MNKIWSMYEPKTIFEVVDKMEEIYSKHNKCVWVSSMVISPGSRFSLVLKPARAYRQPMTLEEMAKLDVVDGDWLLYGATTKTNVVLYKGILPRVNESTLWIPFEVFIENSVEWLADNHYLTGNTFADRVEEEG